ncbi:DOWNSTREAM OF FLC [Spatholobus suberectus]|nr:DOWNSTREAM OF FLC [Spatholobus suberectus]
MVSAIRPHLTPFYVKGRVYCDPCRAGFETPATTYIAGAEVTLQCNDRITNNIVYSKKVRTDSSGSYTIFVDANQANQNCDARLVTSPLPDCKEPTPGRDHSRVILNRFNGIATNDRFVNSLGFMKEKVASGCAKIFRRYGELDNEN